MELSDGTRVTFILTDLPAGKSATVFSTENRSTQEEDGWLTPCGMMPEPKADLTNRSFSEAWKDLTAASDAIKMSGVCDKCANRNICHTCAAIACAETGSTEGIPSYKCRMTQELYEIARRTLCGHNMSPLPDGNSK